MESSFAIISCSNGVSFLFRALRRSFVVIADWSWKYDSQGKCLFICLSMSILGKISPFFARSLRVFMSAVFHVVRTSRSSFGKPGKTERGSNAEVFLISLIFYLSHIDRVVAQKGLFRTEAGRECLGI